MTDTILKHVVAMCDALCYKTKNQNIIERNWILVETGRDIFGEWCDRHKIVQGTIGGSGLNYMFMTDEQFVAYQGRWGVKA